MTDWGLSNLFFFLAQSQTSPCNLTLSPPRACSRGGSATLKAVSNQAGQSELSHLPIVSLHWCTVTTIKAGSVTGEQMRKWCAVFVLDKKHKICGVKRKYEKYDFDSAAPVSSDSSTFSIKHQSEPANQYFYASCSRYPLCFYLIHTGYKARRLLPWWRLLSVSEGASIVLYPPPFIRRALFSCEGNLIFGVTLSHEVVVGMGQMDMWNKPHGSVKHPIWWSGLTKKRRDELN